LERWDPIAWHGSASDQLSSAAMSKGIRYNLEGRKSYAEANPKLVELANNLSDQRPRLSLREI
jgi:hypothetical protein